METTSYTGLIFDLATVDQLREQAELQRKKEGPVTEVVIRDGDERREMSFDEFERRLS